MNTSGGTLDTSRPFKMENARTSATVTVGDEVVHAMLGGATGAGKSVTLNSIIASGMLEYSPWELEFYLMDMKIVELRRYGSRVSVALGHATQAVTIEHYIDRRPVLIPKAAKNMDEFVNDLLPDWETLFEKRTMIGISDEDIDKGLLKACTP